MRFSQRISQLKSCGSEKVTPYGKVVNLLKVGIYQKRATLFVLYDGLLHPLRYRILAKVFGMAVRFMAFIFVVLVVLLLVV